MDPMNDGVADLGLVAVDDPDHRVVHALRDLTRRLVDRGVGELAGGLGGAAGYGVDYEDDTFLMQPFCWCDRDDCPWCGGCTCPDHAFHCFVDGHEVTRQAWVDFYTAIVTADITVNPEAYERQTAEVSRRRAEVHDPVCDYCLGRGVFETNGALPGRGAPNFWHKPTGLRIWWYKYIGRSMEIVAPSDLDDPVAVLEPLAR